MPADTIFVRREKGMGYDVVLSMYHDHGNALRQARRVGELVNSSVACRAGVQPSRTARPSTLPAAALRTPPT